MISGAEIVMSMSCWLHARKRAKRPDLFAREQPLAQSIRDGSPAWLECCFGFKVTRWCHARLVLLSIARELLLIQHSTAQAGAKRDGFAGGFGSATVLI